MRELTNEGWAHVGDGTAGLVSVCVWWGGGGTWLRGARLSSGVGGSREREPFCITGPPEALGKCRLCSGLNPFMSAPACGFNDLFGDGENVAGWKTAPRCGFNDLFGDRENVAG